MTRSPKAIVSVTSDLCTDQRVHRSCMALVNQGFDVLLVGRQLPSSLPVSDRPYAVYRFRLWFTSGPLFYASYNIRLFSFLMFRKAQLLFSNDLDTLTANYFASLLKRSRLVYDSHEYYTGVPELENRPVVKSIWKFFEKMIFPKLATVITVNESIADLYEQEYHKKAIVIRNIPMLPDLPFKSIDKATLRAKNGLPTDKKILILQGSGINVHRGAEEAVEAMRYIDNALLIILGGGDVMKELPALVKKFRLEEKILFLPRMPYIKMMEYTMSSDLGLTFDKDTNLNYRFSLPNKLFDYIHAGIPVLASRLPEIEKIISGYDIGGFIENHDPVHIAERINSIFNDSQTMSRWKNNLPHAAASLSWEQEVKKFPVLNHAVR